MWVPHPFPSFGKGWGEEPSDSRPSKQSFVPPFRFAKGWGTHISDERNKDTTLQGVFVLARARNGERAFSVSVDSAPAGRGIFQALGVYRPMSAAARGKASGGRPGRRTSQLGRPVPSTSLRTCLARFWLGRGLSCPDSTQSTATQSPLLRVLRSRSGGSCSRPFLRTARPSPRFTESKEVC